MTTTTNRPDYWRELSTYDRDCLDEAAGTHKKFGHPGEDRYAFYRRKGHCKADALTYAIAWLRNADEQYKRRLQHATGAEGWRSID